MAITTVDGLLAGMQYERFWQKAAHTTATDRYMSQWGRAGIPGAGSFDATLNGVTLTAPVDGAIPFTNPVSGNTYVVRMNVTWGMGVHILADRLWHNGNYTITSTGAQNSTTPTWPARDINGSTNGEGVFLGVEISSTVGAGTPTITIAYTNSDGTASRSATNTDPTAGSAVTCSFFRIGLQAGDVGVRSVQSLTLSATWTSGTMHLVAYRPIVAVERGFTNPDASTGIDVMGTCFARVYDSSVLWVLYNGGSGTPTLGHRGSVAWTQG